VGLCKALGGCWPDAAQPREAAKENPEKGKGT
jgi:hypothetical protein